MSTGLRITLGVLLCVRSALLYGGESTQVQLQWGELGPRIADQKVALVLPGGTHVEGRVRSVEPDGLRLHVSKTSDRRMLPKGDQLIPRASISVLRVTEYRKLGRLLITTGVIATAAGIAKATYPDIYEGPLLVAVPAVVAGGIAGVGVAGYYAGKRVDRKVTEIRIIRPGMLHPEALHRRSDVLRGRPDAAGDVHRKARVLDY